MKLSNSFYQRNQVTKIAKELLGKKLCTYIDEQRTSGIIVECEAYAGFDDKACHANNGKRTPRTEVFFRDGGIGYVYICYGVHFMFNVITNRENIGDAILIRAVEPIEGIDMMLARRKINKIQYSLTQGPGNVCQALGINSTHNAINLQGNTIWIEEAKNIPSSQIGTSPRIGMGKQAAEDGLKPWRFYIKNNPWVSGKK